MEPLKKQLFVKKAIEHFENSLHSLQSLDLRNFVSRFYYGYITLLFVLGLKEKGDWHKERSYNFPNENFLHIWQELKVWRIRADYEYERGKSFTLYEDELKVFLKKELIEHIEEELKPLIENDRFLSENLALKLTLFKSLEVVEKWLKLLI